MKKKIAMVTAICFIFMALFDVLSFAWMSDNGMSSPVDITSNVHKAYFESGDGTKDIVYDDNNEIISGPFEIARPLQLYYFAWLQYLGFFNNIDNNEDGVLDTVYFRLSQDLDMDYVEGDEHFQYVLPPVGTTSNPFIGNFDGGGHVIKDLTVENLYDSMYEAPTGTDENNFAGVEIIGFFGVIGELATGSYSYDSQANEVKNLVLENLTVKTQTSSALIGMVAGYVNGTVDCVGVVNSAVEIKQGTGVLSYTNNLSDYSLIGYCTDAYRNDVYVLNVSLNKPTTTDPYTVIPQKAPGPDGNIQGWGGSVKMSDIYTWLTDVSEDRATSSRNNYVLQRTDIVALNDFTVTMSNRTNATKLHYTVEGFGSFVFSDSSPNYVNFVSGGQKVTQYEYSYSQTETEEVFYITDGTYYLNFNGSTISSTQDEASATKWYASSGENGGQVYTVIDNRIYYLTINNGNISTIIEVNTTPTSLPQWNFSGSNCSSNGSSIICRNGTWQVGTPQTGTVLSVTYNGTKYYLNANGTNDVQPGTDESTATRWTVTSSSGNYTISTQINNRTYYLSYTKGSGNNATVSNLRLDTSNSSTTTAWLQNGNRFYVQTGNNNNRRYYYLRYNNTSNDWEISTTNSQNTVTQTQVSEPTPDLDPSGTKLSKIIRTESAYIDNSLENSYYNTNGTLVDTNVAGITYFPLSSTVNVANNSYSIDSTNTGYIIGAEWGAIERNEHNTLGNVRIASYSSGSMTNASTPYTMTYKTAGKFKTITDTTGTTLSTLGLQKFADCYEDYMGSIEDACCGIHFMQASVSMTNLTRITASLNGKTKTNYQVPTNCIDFNLYEKGFINFVAGSYYTAENPPNNSFFSIYEIVRDPNDETTITAIKEIRRIYAKMTTNNEIDTKYDYVYTYLIDGEEVGTVPEGYVEVFDCRWITHPNDSTYYGAGGSNPTAWANNRAYYFEVPVNKGEYAIGSTEGRTGAYLTYLDLAANAQLIERNKQYEEITENRTDASFPDGVEMLQPSTSYDTTQINPEDSSFASINAGTSGTIDFDQTGADEITHSAKSGTSAEYIGIDEVLKDGNNAEMSMEVTQTTKIERTTYRDYNINTKETTVTVITKTTVTKGETQTVTYSRTITKTTAAGVTTTTTTPAQAGELFPETKDKTGSPASTKGDKLIDFAFSYGQSVALTVSYEYIPAGKDAEGNATAPTYLITITNPGADDVTIKAILTAIGAQSGITFIITDGTTQTVLTASEAAQTVVIKGTGEQPGTGTDEGTGEGTDATA